MPAGLSTVTAIAAGWDHSLALKQDGTVAAWGAGAPGAPTGSPHFGQATVPSGLTDVTAIAGGGYHSLALKKDGTVVAWGRNNYGQTNVPPSLGGVVAIAAGIYHSLALKKDGTAVAWGDDRYDLTTIAGDSRIMAIAAGGSISLGLISAPLSLQMPAQTQTAQEGSTIRLHLSAEGGFPLSYQWFLNGTNAISGGTNSFLELPDIQAAQGGGYTAVVTDRFGSALTSNPAMLSVIPPLPRETIPALKFTGGVGTVLQLKYASALGPNALWQDLDTVTLTTTPQFYPELATPLPSCRFYRATQITVPGMPQNLEEGLATKVTLTGVVGGKVRVDYINQFGPTDAWQTLDTAVMTNTSQPYFDFTMFHQPARLYRLVQVP